MLVDSHCHLQLIDYPALGTTLDGTIAFAKKEGVAYFLCVGTTLEDRTPILAIAEQYPFVYASVGLHPNEKIATEPTVETLVLLANHPKIIAIGETGLDYYRTDSDNYFQTERFIRHIHAAKETQKPLIIHTRQARKETLALLSQEKAGEIGGVLHCFTEDWETAKGALDLGFHLSFSGIITFKNAIDLQEVVKKAPLDRILIETDSPYLAPVPHRGKTNQPAYVKYVAECIAELKGITFENVSMQTSQNFSQLFLKGLI